MLLGGHWPELLLQGAASAAAMRQVASKNRCRSRPWEPSPKALITINRWYKPVPNWEVCETTMWMFRPKMGRAPRAGWFISWKIHQWMILGTPVLGDLYMASSGNGVYPVHSKVFNRDSEDLPEDLRLHYFQTNP